MAEMITKTFPFETGFDIFHLDNNTHRPRGRLYDVYSELRAECVVAKLCEAVQKPKKKQSTTPPVADIESRAQLEILKQTSSPWGDVAELWKNTRLVRIEELEKVDTFDHYLSMFPALRDPRSSELLVEDGRIAMIDSGWQKKFNIKAILKNFEAVMEKNVRYLDEAQKQVLEMVKSSNNSENLRSVLAFSLLPLCMKGRKRTRSDTDEPNADAARQRAYENFLPTFNSTDQIDKYVRKMKNQVYPYGYIVLDENVTLVIQIGNYSWAYSDPSDGFDAFFKIFFALGINFNPKSAKFHWIAGELAFELSNDNYKQLYSCVNSRNLLKLLS